MCGRGIGGVGLRGLGFARGVGLCSSGAALLAFHHQTNEKPACAEHQPQAEHGTRRDLGLAAEVREFGAKRTPWQGLKPAEMTPFRLGALTQYEQQKQAVEQQKQAVGRHD